MSTLRIVAVTAGLSQPSSTRILADRLADATAKRLAEAGRQVEIEIVELRDLAVDIAHAMVTGFPAGRLREVLDSVAAADGVIAVSPVFTASYSGLFKSFFDVLANEALTGTPVLAAATGGTARHSLVLEHAMRPMFAYLRAVVAPTAVYAASEDWGSGDGLVARIDRAAGEFAALVAGLSERVRARPGVDGFDDVIPFEQQMAALRAPLGSA